MKTDTVLSYGYVLPLFRDIPRMNKSSLLVLRELAMLGGSLVTMAWRILRLQMEETASRYGG
jgi:hypothetical protein